MSYRNKINKQAKKAADSANRPLCPDADLIFKTLLDEKMKQWNKLSQEDRDAAMQAQMREDYEAEMMKDSYR